MVNLQLNQEIINKVQTESVPLVQKAMGNDLKEMILYGSCSRGDYSEDSDIDIALLTTCDRMDAKKYTDTLAEVATELALKYVVVVNFVCLPQKEYEEKKNWYPYFRNIEKEGKVLYGR